MMVLPLLAALVPTRGSFYLMLALALGGFAGGLYVSNKFHKAEQLEAVNRARVQEQDAARNSNALERKHLADLRRQKEEADAKLDKLRARLARSTGCAVPVPPEWVRERAAVPGPARAPGGAGPAAPGVDQGPSLDSRDAILACERNRLEVAEPNAAQLKALQEWYDALLERYGRR